jgi:hypothetical protein
VIKKFEVSDPTSCLNKAADDEPVFVLRAHDRTAAQAVRWWLENALDLGCQLSPEKVEHAHKIIAAMEAWPDQKLPD